MIIPANEDFIRSADTSRSFGQTENQIRRTVNDAEIVGYEKNCEISF
jgi:hypothetical protein